MNFENDINNISSMLDYLSQNGIIEKSSADDAIYAMKQNELKRKEKIVLGVHNHTITPPHENEKRWKTYIDTDDGRKLIAKTSKETFFRFMYEHYFGKDYEDKYNPKVITINDLFPEWLEYKSLHTQAPSYIARIKGTWNSHYKETEIVNIPLCKLTKLVLDEWVHKMIQKENMTKKQYYNTTLIMRQILEYACDKEILESNQMKKVKVDSRRMFRREEKKDDRKEVFTDKEVDELTALAYSDYKSRSQTVHVLSPLAIIFQFQTGLRLGELCAIRYEDIKGNYILVSRMVIDKSNNVVDRVKGNAEPRQVYLTNVAKNIINEAHKYQTENNLPNDGYIFSVNENPVFYRGIQRLYHKYCSEIGTEQKSSHKARKTYISCLIDAGVNINTVRRLAGHADEKTTLRNYVYDRSEESERNEVIAKALEYKN